MKVLIAFDKFKDALSAADACTAASAALRSEHADWTVQCCPLSDGGDGLVDTLTPLARGERRAHTIHGPRGQPASAVYGLVRWADIPTSARRLLHLAPEPTEDDSIAIAEMAAASGLALLPATQRDPWQTTTVGTGELLADARQQAVRAIILGAGGSATNDLGVAALATLGLEFLDSTGQRVADVAPAAWSRIERVTGTAPVDLPQLRIACDVSHPLLGPNGCTAAFGPQKGLRDTDVPRMEAAVERMSALLCQHAGRELATRMLPGAGAAGGIAFGLSCCAGAALVSGIALVSAWLDLDRKIAEADCVITGEGRFDAGSLQGKGPGHIARAAAGRGKVVHVFAGQVRAAPEAGLALHQITPAGMPLAAALPRTAELLEKSVAEAFR